MKNSVFGLGLAVVLGAGLVLGSAGMATAEVKGKKVFVAKPASKVVVVRPAPRHSNRNRNIGLGVAAVVGTAIAIEAARGSSYRGGGMSCPALERRCDDGQNWACRRLEERPDC